MKRIIVILIYGLMFLTIVNLISSQTVVSPTTPTGGVTIPTTGPASDPNSPLEFNKNNKDISIEDKDGVVTISVKTEGATIVTSSNGEKFENLKAGSFIKYQRIKEAGKADKFGILNGKLESSKDGQTYKIWGYEVKHPKGGYIEFEDKKDSTNAQKKSIRVIVPKDGLVEAPKVSDETKAKDTKISFEPKEGDFLKLPNEGSFTTLQRKTDEKTLLYFDPVKNQFYSEKPFKVDNLEVGTFKNSDSGKTYILFDSSKTNDLKENFLYLGSKDDKYKLMVGATGSNGASVRFVPTSGTINYGGIKAGSDDMLAIQARGINDRSVITVTSREGEKLRPLIQANGEYDMFHGNSFIEYTKEGGIRHGYLNTKTFNGQTIDFSKTTAVAVEVESKTSSGEQITQKFKDKTGKEQTALVDWNIFVDKNNLRLTANADTQKVLRDVKFGQLDGISQTKLLGLKKEDQLRLIGLEFNLLKTELDKVQIQPGGTPGQTPPGTTVTPQKVIDELKKTAIGPYASAGAIQPVSAQNPNGFDPTKHKVIITVLGQESGCPSCVEMKKSLTEKYGNNAEVYIAYADSKTNNRLLQGRNIPQINVYDWMGRSVSNSNIIGSGATSISSIQTRIEGLGRIK